ncbi:hypothetical protein CEUSTIGMA_g122.t1 [Chlamydomonas eustigma]|uniref:Iron export ABC transporter permease subunit FetB n=1 Tax=Chlamydomonas eustigma TaxID=1157962 RepID=A0A250WPP1_9CHLO|nr:hypothetical protein CEUSTIGMA_g122.t1 [Chlamydomonas eustigma]|eukprot:GAX72666.1 hypothetical protein CEUSTIGMA_g122.t1 [Chlamydomonas eustigma]
MATNSTPPDLPPSPQGADGVIDLTPAAVALSAAVLLINALISLRLELGMHKQLLIATVRMIIQLSILGFILKPIFDINSPWLVLGYASFMIVIASVEAVSRPQQTYKGILVNVLFCMAFSSGTVLSYVVLVVMSIKPWWEAQYVIPMLGMLLGNCTSGISLGLNTVLEELSTKRDSIEWLLSMGANRWEATDAMIKRAVKTSMTPLLNQMSVIGLVSIPGMMTGQILAGSDPMVAAKYQMLIMFVVGGSSGLASLFAIYVTALHVVDIRHCYRQDRLIKKEKAKASAPWIYVKKMGTSVYTLCCCCCLMNTRSDEKALLGGEGHSIVEPLLPTNAKKGANTPPKDVEVGQRQ